MFAQKTLASAPSFVQSKQWQQSAHALIPGGCHTYSKGDDQFPEQAPGFIVRGKGCRVWDVDGNEFIEYGMGLRAVTLGHAYEPVVQAAYRQMLNGSNFTRPATLEVTCAEVLTDLIEGAEMVKFTKDGSTATTGAFKLARAYTGREKIAVCADHPFYSYDDWYIGSTNMHAGIPEATRSLTLKFRYNDIESVQALFDEHPGEIACLILEPARLEDPTDGFLHKTRDLCHKHGALFVLDEMITGFRWHVQGGQKYYDIVPDLSTFGKAMGNGFSVSALVGKREFMERGGLHHDQERVFLLSTTHGAETHALAAMLETISIYQTEPVVPFLHQQGERLRTGINQTIEELNLQPYFELLGKPCNLIYATRDQDQRRSQPFRTLFLQELIKRGLIAPSLVVSYSHSEEVIDRTIEAVSEALVVYREALDNGIEGHLEGRPVKPVFRMYN